MKAAVGLVGYRGMVGSVLLERMAAEGDFGLCRSTFFSSGLKGSEAPEVPNGHRVVLDSYDLDALAGMDILLVCQGSEYSKEIYPQLVARGWQGKWIDASSAFRLDADAVLAFDPINEAELKEAIRGNKIQKFIGANCSITLFLLGAHGLFREGLVEWVSSMTYQAASGAGAETMLEMLRQTQVATQGLNLAQDILQIDRQVSERVRAGDFPKQTIGAGLGLSLIPWIDGPMDSGQTREEWKGMVEANKLLGLQGAQAIPVDGLCVRVGVMRCHSNAVTLKLRKKLPLATIEALIAQANPWVEFVPNTKADTLARLTPSYVTGKLKVSVGRVRYSTLGEDVVHLFTVGDQLLWGAAEPLRRVLRMML